MSSKPHTVERYGMGEGICAVPQNLSSSLGIEMLATGGELAQGAAVWARLASWRGREGSVHFLRSAVLSILQLQKQLNIN